MHYDTPGSITFLGPDLSLRECIGDLNRELFLSLQTRLPTLDLGAYYLHLRKTSFANAGSNGGTFIG